MKRNMETEFIFWRHATSAGVQVEEICGGEDKSQRLWMAMALQVFGENGAERFREIDHTASGAPLLADEPQRISVSHTTHFMVVAMLPRTPEADLTCFNIRTAMGVDCERADRSQVLKVAERVLSSDELRLVADYAAALERGDAHHAPLDADAAQVRAHVLAWTIKEALYKAALAPGLDFRSALVIKALPEICSTPLAGNPRFGRAVIERPADQAGARTESIDMELFSYESEGHIVTLAYSPRAAKWKRVKA